jgi:ADP-ribosylglycohydrolase
MQRLPDSYSPPGPDKLESRRTLEHFTGCLLGGAVGDALGAPVEFHSIDLIRNKYGSAGITDYDVAYGRRGAITDDTQMTLFTAEGLLRAIARRRHKSACRPASLIHRAYIRWLRTQGDRSRAHFSQDEMDGWLIGAPGLHSRRAPGNTCLSALRGEEMGEMQRPLNHSKGCGGVMRVAPVGLVAEDEERAFSLGCEAAAISLYCALAAQDDFTRDVLLAVNHSGDSDSTGAITGNLLGLTLGAGAIPEKWLSGLELRAEIEAVAGDLLKQFENTDSWWNRYPG